MYYRGAAAAIIVYDITRKVVVGHGLALVCTPAMCKFMRVTQPLLSVCCGIAGVIWHTEELGERVETAWT